MPKATFFWKMNWLKYAEFAIAIFFLYALIQQISSRQNECIIGDPDNYMMYARVIKDNWGPQIHDVIGRRKISIGYPFLLAAASKLFQAGDNFRVFAFRTQASLLIAFLIGVWLFVRHIFGKITALIALALFAAPNYFVFMAVTPMPDFVFLFMWVPLALLAIMYLFGRQTLKTYGCLLMQIIGFLAVSLVKTSNMVLLLLLIGSAVITLIFWKWKARSGKGKNRTKLDSDRISDISLKGFLSRVTIVIVIAVGTHMMAGWIVDFEPQKFYKKFFMHKVVNILPPAFNSTAEIRIEGIKNKICLYEGQRLEDHIPQIRSEFNEKDVELVWQDRLIHHPFLFLAKAFREVLLKYYPVSMDFFPFKGYQGYWNFRLLPVDDSLRSRIHRRTGILLPESCFRTTGGVVCGLMIALIKLMWTWATLGFGVFLLSRKYSLEAITFTIAMLLYAFFTACSVIMDGRYLLPFVAFIFTAQAAAISEGLRRFIVWLGNRGILTYEGDIH